ncbi:MAG TPA: hypothetical protein VEW03_16235 [Longimicrobiaceae bacterium]|nr:hypothetical protein [Longimicrobiaceae bacterium]
MRISRRLVVVAIASALCAGPSAAQSIEALSFGAGLMDQGLWEGGEAAAFNLRVEMPWRGMLLLEPGLVFARGNLPGEGGATLLVPELQAQLQLPLGGAAAYLGAGMGMALAWRAEENGGFAADPAPSIGAGVRIDYGGLLGFVIDGRLRGSGLDFDDRTRELTVGVRLRR